MAAMSAQLMMAGASAGDAYSQSQATKAQGAYQKRVALANAAKAEEAAADSLAQGQKSENEYRRKIRKTLGAQRVAAAAQGVDIDSGTIADIQEETREIGEADIATIRTNAIRQAYGFTSQANNEATAGRIAEITANAQANSTIIAGGMRALSYTAMAASKLPNKSKTTFSSFDDKKLSAEQGAEREKIGSIW